MPYTIGAGADSQPGTCFAAQRSYYQPGSLAATYLERSTIMSLSNCRMSNCHKLYINGRLFAITHTYDEAFLILEALSTGGMEITTHAIKAAFIPDVAF